MHIYIKVPNKRSANEIVFNLTTSKWFDGLDEHHEHIKAAAIVTGKPHKWRQLGSVQLGSGSRKIFTFAENS